MPPWDDWNRVDEEEDEELQDASVSTLCPLVSVTLAELGK
jgi:hypothetical protein